MDDAQNDATPSPCFDLGTNLQCTFPSFAGRLVHPLATAFASDGEHAGARCDGDPGRFAVLPRSFAPGRGRGTGRRGRRRQSSAIRSSKRPSTPKPASPSIGLSTSSTGESRSTPIQPARSKTPITANATTTWSIARGRVEDVSVSTAVSPSLPVSRSGISCRTADRAGPTMRLNSSEGRAFNQGRSAATSGSYGRAPSPRSTHAPTRKRTPAGSAPARSSESSRVLPTPASPPTMAVPTTPDPASSSTACSRSSSSPRPTNTGARDSCGHRAIIRSSARGPWPRDPGLRTFVGEI